MILDLYGVLVDPDETKRQYRRRLAAILRRDYGGDEGEWARAYDAAHGASTVAVSRRGSVTNDYDASLRAADELWLDTLFRAVLRRRPDGEARVIVGRLEEEVFNGLDASYPGTVGLLAELEGMGVELCVATGARLAQARQALRAGGLHRHVHSILSAEMAGSRKSDDAFWSQAFSSLRRSPPDCVVVDDKVDYLAPAARAGAYAVWLHRHGMSWNSPRFKLAATLEGLQGLPAFLRRVGV